MAQLFVFQIYKGPMYYHCNNKQEHSSRGRNTKGDYYEGITRDRSILKELWRDVPRAYVHRQINRNISSSVVFRTGGEK